ncbi:hypothetical protein CYMTET_55413 [Cymbomonas tetramitiformis]|uniref:Uncharacterized protein n=1 Tax=Cymbomonas tetramitiformis TaxID=36881 RepID=A0AAE0BDD9_9CHLO|nr:hypothetical protein CYMTET_55413 [Cymbomonas tetramitiformis]
MQRDVDVLISTQANAFQDNHTLLRALQHLDKQLTQRGVKKPVLWLTDGQSSRFNLNVLDFAEENGLAEFVYPPHTTTAHALLDRVFHMWHNTYSKSVDDWSKANPGKSVTKAVFAAVFPGAWEKWTRSIRVQRVALKVGIGADGIFPERISDSFFVKSNLQSEVANAAQVVEEKCVLPPFTPEEGTFSTRTQKLEEENRLLREELLRVRAQPLSPEEIGLCLIKTDAHIPEVGTSRRKATQVWGSVPASGLRDSLRKAEREEEEKRDKIEMQEMFTACARELERIEQEEAAPARQLEEVEREAERARKVAEKEAERARKAAEKAGCTKAAGRVFLPPPLNDDDPATARGPPD